MNFLFKVKHYSSIRPYLACDKSSNAYERMHGEKKGNKNSREGGQRVYKRSRKQLSTRWIGCPHNQSPPGALYNLTKLETKQFAGVVTGFIQELGSVSHMATLYQQAGSAPPTTRFSWELGVAHTISWHPRYS